MDYRKVKPIGWFGLVLLMYAIVPSIIPFQVTGIDVDNVVSVNTDYLEGGGCKFNMLTDSGLVDVVSPDCNVKIKTSGKKIILSAEDYINKRKINDALFFQFYQYRVGGPWDSYGPTVGVTHAHTTWRMPLFCGGPDCISQDNRCDDGVWEYKILNSNPTCFIARASDSIQSVETCTTHMISTDSCSTSEGYKMRNYDKRTYVESSDGLWRIYFDLPMHVKCGGSCDNRHVLNLVFDKNFADKQLPHAFPTTTTTLLISQTTTTLDSQTTTTSSTSTTIPGIPDEPIGEDYSLLRLAAGVLGLYLARKGELLSF